MKPMTKIAGVITLFSTEPGEARSDGSGGVEQQLKRKVRIELSLTKQTKKTETAIDSIFPGVEHMMKAAAGKNDGENKASAFKVAMDRNVPPITVKVRNAMGEDVFSSVNVKLMGKPTLRIGAGVSSVSMTITFHTVLSDEVARVAEGHVGSDVSVDLGVSQESLKAGDGDGADDDKQQ